MNASIAALFRHPIKGFTPEKLNHVWLEAGGAFPGDRLFAVEDGPCGFDPAAPAWVPKQRFTVLAKIAEVARARTAYDEASGVLRAKADGAPDFEGRLCDEAGKVAFAAWLTQLLGEAASGPLRVVDGLGHRFLDHPLGHVSIINLASVRDLAQRLGRPIDPLRFRANLYVEGWEAWAENGWEGRQITLGDATATVFKPIVRCAAPGVDPATAVRDLDIPAELHRLYGHLHCGIYVQVTGAGGVKTGDAAVVAA
ncbi:MAG TPA: MOSC N-terminal beta barrel domain-containing protein [Caulobacteraceae bacterium]|nr:MOSC N-terminal beta barrel domain-containing protein [Caulobacteraceae bacterium]